MMLSVAKLSIILLTPELFSIACQGWLAQDSHVGTESFDGNLHLLVTCGVASCNISPMSPLQLDAWLPQCSSFSSVLSGNPDQKVPPVNGNFRCRMLQRELILF